MRIRQILGSCLTIGLLAVSAPVMAEDTKTDDEIAAELDEAAKNAIEAAEGLINALRLFVDNLPQYAAPEILENGDILIRRLPSKSDKASTDEDADAAEE